MPPKANEAIDSLIDIEQYTAAPFSTRAAGPDEGQRLADEALENSWVKFFLTTEFGNNPESVEALLDMWRLYGEKSNPNIVTKDELPPGVGASYNRQDIFSHYLLNKPDYMNLQEGDFYGFIDELAHGFQFSREPESQLMPTVKKLEDVKKLDPSGRIRPGSTVKKIKVTKGGAYPTYAKKTVAAKSFSEKFKSERKKQGSGKTFTWDGRSYSTNTAQDLKKSKKPAKK